MNGVIRKFDSADVTQVVLLIAVQIIQWARWSKYTTEKISRLRHQFCNYEKIERQTLVKIT